jgi:hypothetical protein
VCGGGGGPSGCQRPVARAVADAAFGVCACVWRACGAWGVRGAQVIAEILKGLEPKVRSCTRLLMRLLTLHAPAYTLMSLRMSLHIRRQMRWHMRLFVCLLMLLIWRLNPTSAVRSRHHEGEADEGEADEGEADEGDADEGEADEGEADEGEGDEGVAVSGAGPPHWHFV